LWFETTGAPVTWILVSPPKPIEALDAKRRPLHGIEFEISTDVADLQPRAAVLSSIRVLRDFELQSRAPAEVMVAPREAQDRIEWQRDRLDGAAGYRLTVFTVRGKAGAPLRLRVQALTGEPPLTPLDAPVTVRGTSRAQDALTFLSYREKFLAGSWRFDTYFGRDTLMS